MLGELGNDVFRKKRDLPTVRSSVGHDVDRAAKGVLRSVLPRQWSLNSVDEDYGLDFFVDVIESFTPTGVRFGVQLKGVDRPKIVDDAIHFSFPTKNLGTYVLKEELPVFLVVADTKTRRAWFLFLQQHADEQLSGDDWGGRDTVTVKVPLANRISASNKERLRRAVVEARQYMRDVRSSPVSALARRSRLLERLDPRFRVEPKADTGGESYTLVPKQDVHFSVSFSGLDSERRALLRRGHVVPVASGEVTFHDMPIFEHLADSIQRIEIAATVRVTATVEVERDGIVATLPNMPTTVKGGLDEIRVHARYDNAPIDVRATIEMLDRTGKRAKVRFDVEHAVDERWFGQRIRDLAHFERLSTFADISAAPYRIKLRLHLPNAEDDFEVPWGGPIGEERVDHDAYLHAMEALRLARSTAGLLDVNPPLPRDVLVAGLGDVELLHDLLTAGEHEGDGSKAVFDGRTPTSSEYLAKLEASHGAPTDFEASPRGADCVWTFLKEHVRVPIDTLRLTKASCTATRMPDALIRIVARGTPGSRFWVRRHAIADEPT